MPLDSGAALPEILGVRHFYTSEVDAYLAVLCGYFHEIIAVLKEKAKKILYE